MKKALLLLVLIFGAIATDPVHAGPRRGSGFNEGDLEMEDYPIVLAERASNPATPLTDEGKIFIKDAAGITTPYFIDSSGTVTSLLGSAATGDIESVTAGAGLTGGGLSGAVTLDVIGTADRITVGANAIDIASTYVGQSSITTLGTITTGTWDGTDLTAAELGADSVSASELDATGVEAELEAVMDLQDMQGAVTNGQVPDTITIDLATVATTANAGDSATSFFGAGTIEHDRGGLEADINAYDGLIGITGGATYNVTGSTTQIIIFDGAGAPTVAALSGDVTMTNAGAVTIGADKVALTTETTGNYAAGDGEAGAALTGDSATSFFSSGTVEGARLGTFTKSFCITGVTSAGDFGAIWKTPSNITITRINVVQVGATNVVGQLDECDSNGANCTAIDSADITADGLNDADDGALSNAAVDANDWIGWHTTSVSGTNTRTSITFDYTVS